MGSRALGRLCMFTCARVRARACVGGNTSVVRDVLTLTLTLTPRVCVCVLPRAQSMNADPMAFIITSDEGAAVEGRVLVRGVGGTSRRQIPWALVGARIESMLTAAGDAWSEFEHVEGNGDVYVFVAPEGLDTAASLLSTAGNGAMACWMYAGAVYFGARVFLSTPDWGARIAPGESVRVRYVAATRMVCVVWRGRAHDLAALPATSDIAHMRFGVALGFGNSMRVTGASAGARASSSGVARDVNFVEYPPCFSRGACFGVRAQRSALPRAACAIHRALPRDVPGGTCPRRGRARRHRGVALRARPALGRRARVRAPAGILECCRARLVCVMCLGRIRAYDLAFVSAASAAIFRRRCCRRRRRVLSARARRKIPRHNHRGHRRIYISAVFRQTFRRLRSATCEALTAVRIPCPHVHF